MKKSILSLAFLVVTLVTTNTFAQKFKKIDVSPMDASSYPDNWREADKLVKVIYSRPKLKGRSLSKLAPNDKVWRTGANEATEITFYKDVVFGGEEVKAGIYTLFTIPSEDKWTLILSNQKNIWGSYFYNKKEDVARVEGKVTNAKDSVEAFSIVFEEQEEGSVNMYLGWANKVISVSIKG